MKRCHRRAITLAMWPYHPELLAVPVPRYTSFPTAAEFHSGIAPHAVEQALAETSGPVSLYVHIPYCEQICWYCGCNTGRANRRQRLESYLDALHREIALVSGKLGKHAAIGRVAFGGGSPNAIAPTDFVRLVDELTLHFALDNPLWSIELDPRTLTAEWGPVLAAIGITNASLGVQTFDPGLQAAIGRVQPESQIRAATALLRDNGITSLNFDLMYGLPGQTAEILAQTLNHAVELGADRIALFGYAHVPHLIPRQQRIDASALPDQAARFAMAQHGSRLLTQAGYVPVGFDHFALPHDPLAKAALNGTLHRNFQGFTDDGAPVLIGLGASAISQFPGLSVQNEKNAGRYRMLLSQNRMPVAHGLVRSEDDVRRGVAIADLLCRGQARLDDMLVAEVAPLLEPFRQRGLARIECGELLLLSTALPYARSIAALMDPYRRDSARRFSSAV